MAPQEQETMTTCELRLKAAAVIEERGWTQKTFCATPDGPVCLLGALIVACGGEPLVSDINELVACEVSYANDIWRATAAMGFINNEPEPHQWNDAPDRTKDEVLARLRDGCQSEAR